MLTNHERSQETLVLKSVFSSSVLSNVWFSNLYKTLTNGTIALECLALKQPIAAQPKVLSCFCEQGRQQRGEREMESPACDCTVVWQKVGSTVQVSESKVSIQVIRPNSLANCIINVQRSKDISCLNLHRKVLLCYRKNHSKTFGW